MNAQTENSLDAALTRAVEEIREAYNTALLHNMQFKIDVQGRVNGELKIEYSFWDKAGLTWVHSHSVGAALDELMRRVGWNKHNTAKLLPYAPAAEPAGDDMTF